MLSADSPQSGLESYFQIQGTGACISAGAVHGAAEFAGVIGQCAALAHLDLSHADIREASRGSEPCTSAWAVCSPDSPQSKRQLYTSTRCWEACRSAGPVPSAGSVWKHLVFPWKYFYKHSSEQLSRQAAWDIVMYTPEAKELKEKRCFCSSVHIFHTM